MKNFFKSIGSFLYNYRNNSAVHIYLFILFGFYPIVYTNRHFFELNECRYFVFLFLSLSLIIVTVYNAIAQKNIIRIYNVKNSLRSFSILDYSMLVFCFVSIFSGFCSPFFPDTIGGASGRYGGVVTICIYTIIYFIISRGFCKKLANPLFIVFSISSSLVFLIGILNFFQLDPLHFYIGVKQNEQAIFISTIGNRDFFGSFLCLTLPIFMVWFINKKEMAFQIISFLAVSLGFMALYIDDCDSAYLGIISVFLILPLFVWKTSRQVIKYWMMCLLFFLSCLLIHDVNVLLCPNTRWTLNGISKLLSNNLFVLCSILCIIILLGVLVLLKISLKFHLKNGYKKLKIIWGMFLLIITLFFVVFLIYMNVASVSDPLESLAPYFCFSTQWGSGRGAVWIALLLAFCRFPFFQKLFGSGPDTIYQVLAQYFPEQLKDGSLLCFDAAHNEYLQYLVTLGVIGFIAYLTVLIYCLYKGFQYARSDSLILAVTLILFSYAIQGFFNISMITTTPYFFTFIGILSSLLRGKKGDVFVRFS